MIADLTADTESSVELVRLLFVLHLFPDAVHLQPVLAPNPYENRSHDMHALKSPTDQWRSRYQRRHYRHWRPMLGRDLVPRSPFAIEACAED